MTKLLLTFTPLLAIIFGGGIGAYWLFLESGDDSASGEQIALNQVLCV